MSAGLVGSFRMNLPGIHFLLLATIILGSCGDAREIRSRIDDPTERAAYIAFLNDRGQKYTEMPDGTIVVKPKSSAAARDLENAVEAWHAERAELFNRAQQKQN